jgi:hypothetical protein
MGLTNHKPIDYTTWDYSGQGKNILPFLDREERIIWAKTLPFQDKRKDTGHAETATYFANILLQYFPEADRRIVIPATILHDTGWGKMSEEDLKLFYAPRAEFQKLEPLLRWKHQTYGTVFAAEIMEQMRSEGYTGRHAIEVQKIISEHDTKKGFGSLEEGLMRAGDMLWRFTFMDAYKEYQNRKNFSFEEHWAQHPRWLSDSKFFHPDIAPIAREIANIEMENTKRYMKEKGIGQ